MSEGVHVPGGYPSDALASESQRDAVERFYLGTTFDALTDDQAGALLDYREYARAAIGRLAPNLFREDARKAAEAVAVFISRDREIAEGVVRMMRRRFENGADPDGLVKAITRLEWFEDIEAYCDELLYQGD